MRIEIYDVDHGQCAMVYCPNDKKIMVDIGHNANRPWHPAVAFYNQIIDLLIITNLDKDHVSGYSGMSAIPIRSILINPSVNSTALLSLKTDGFCDSMKEIYKWLVAKEQQAAPPTYIDVQDWGGVTIHTFQNPYPLFDDTNNLSTATFIRYAGFTILFPGDLEKEGWLTLLQNRIFLSYLVETTVLVAPHHGRENGCCDEVFNFCNPQIVIISDKQKEHDTQETTSWYNSKASGIPLLVPPYGKRSVLTTRKDGHMVIQVEADGRWIINAEKIGQRPEPSPLVQALLKAYT